MLRVQRNPSLHYCNPPPLQPFPSGHHLREAHRSSEGTELIRYWALSVPLIARLSLTICRPWRVLLLQWNKTLTHTLPSHSHVGSRWASVCGCFIVYVPEYALPQATGYLKIWFSFSSLMSANIRLHSHPSPLYIDNCPAFNMMAVSSQPQEMWLRCDSCVDVTTL